MRMAPDSSNKLPPWLNRLWIRALVMIFVALALAVVWRFIPKSDPQHGEMNRQQRAVQAEEEYAKAVAEACKDYEWLLDLVESKRVHFCSRGDDQTDQCALKLSTDRNGTCVVECAPIYSQEASNLEPAADDSLGLLTSSRDEVSCTPME